MVNIKRYAQTTKNICADAKLSCKDICCCRSISAALSQQKTSAGISTKPIPDALFICEKAKRKQQSCRGIIDCSIKQLNIELDEM